MSLLIIGGTGTLGRQIVLQALNQNYKVRCLVRNFKKANFLKEWGAELVYGDLTKPETIPPSLKGITAVIDASTSRPDDLGSLKNVDWKGKLYLIEAAKVAKIERFIFFSVQNVEQFTDIPLMKLKFTIEQKLKESHIPFTIFRLTGFYQNLIEQYAIPILEDLPVWVTNENLPMFYMDTQDIAIFCLRTLQLPKTKNQLFILNGLKGWLSSEIIRLCEQRAGQLAKIQQIPSFLLNFLSNLFQFFTWGQNIGDRLAFVKVLNTKPNLSQSTSEIYKLFKVTSTEMNKLEDYVVEYYIRVLLRLRDINFKDIQRQRNLIL